MAEQDTDRSEEATPHKLEDARNKGSVAKSQDFNSMAMMAGLVISIYAGVEQGLRKTLVMQQKLLAEASSRAWSAEIVAQWLGDLLVGMLSVMAPFFLTLFLMAVLANFFQTGPIFSFHPLKPDIDRINPVSGMKRILSIRTLFEAVKSIIKLTVLAGLLYVLVRNALPGLIGLANASPRNYLYVLVALVTALLVKLALALFGIGLLDLLFTRWEFGKRMRMSKRDVRDESKNREGDPRVRSRIRELRKEMLKRSLSASKVQESDVLITNPTRVAVALSYRHGSSGAPRVIAKGSGDIARKMRKLAARHQIPIVQNKLLARALFREVDYDGYVPEKWYPLVAKIMVWVYASREAQRANSKGM